MSSRRVHSASPLSFRQRRPELPERGRTGSTGATFEGPPLGTPFLSDHSPRFLPHSRAFVSTVRTVRTFVSHDISYLPANTRHQFTPRLLYRQGRQSVHVDHGAA